MSKPKNQIVHLTHSRRKGREVLFKLKPRDKQREIEKEIKRIFIGRSKLTRFSWEVHRKEREKEREIVKRTNGRQ